MILDLEFKCIEQNISLDFNEDKKLLDLNFDSFQQITSHNVENYGGEYDVTPKVESQTLRTKEKYLLKDVTIKAIPFFEVSNLDGGQTVYIGKEI